MAESEDKGKNMILLVGSSKERDGVKEDFEIIKTLETLYNCEIHNLIDRTANDYKTFFSQLKDDPAWLDKFRKCNFVAVVCLFHGKSDGRINFDSNVLLLKSYFLNPLFCIQQLDGKLKWLIVQACRGKLTDIKIQPDGEKVKNYLDIHMVSYCTGEGALSYQFDKHGKIFIEYLCEELTDNATKHKYERSLCAMMNSVNDKIKQYGENKKLSNFPRSEHFKNFEDYSFKSAI